MSYFMSILFISLIKVICFFAVLIGIWSGFCKNVKSFDLRIWGKFLLFIMSELRSKTFETEAMGIFLTYNLMKDSSNILRHLDRKITIRHSSGPS